MKTIVLTAALFAFAGAASAQCAWSSKTAQSTPVVTAPATGS